MALTGMAIAAALALAKNQLVDKPNADKKRKYEAQTAALSPWTGMKSEPVATPDPIGPMIQYGGAGAAMGSQINKDNAAADLMRSGSTAINSSIGESPAYASKLGDQAKNFSTDMNASIGAGAHPVTSNMDFSSGSGWEPMAAKGDFSYNPPADPNDPAVKYKTLMDKGLNPKNPEEYWQINPFKQNY